MTSSPTQVAAPPRSDAMTEFRRWYHACGPAGLLRVTSQGLLDVDSKLSDEFMIGTLGNRWFIGIPESVSSWFLRAPWLHLAVRPGLGGIALVCGRLTDGKQALKEFALYFDGVHSTVADSLMHYHYIDIRLIVSNGEAGTRSVSRKAAMTMEVVPVSGERVLDTFLSGRSASAYRSRVAAGAAS